MGLPRSQRIPRPYRTAGSIPAALPRAMFQRPRLDSKSVAGYEQHEGVPRLWCEVRSDDGERCPDPKRPQNVFDNQVVNAKRVVVVQIPVGAQAFSSATIHNDSVSTAFDSLIHLSNNLVTSLISSSTPP